MKKEFSAYEFAGVIVPGATLFLCAAFIGPPMREFVISGNFDLGELGLFVIASYVAGHLIQGFGNILEKAVWAFRGMPSTWIRREKPPFLSDEQTNQLHPALIELLGHGIQALPALDKRACDGIRGQVYARLQQAGRTERLDAFNGNYGMFRGIATSVLLAFVASAWRYGLVNATTGVFAVVAVVSLMRMHRFGVHYAAELFRQVLDLAQTTKRGKTP